MMFIEDERRFEIYAEDVSKLGKHNIRVQATIKVPDTAYLTSYTEWTANFTFVVDATEAAEAVRLA